MKKALKFVLIVFLYSLLTIVTTTAMPYSQAFNEASANSDPMSVVYVLISSALFCFAICFIAANANWRGAKRAIGIIFAVFMIASFMTQIETWFFGDVFPLLTVLDILYITLAPLPSIVAATLLGIKFFGHGGPVEASAPVPIAQIAWRVAALGFIYAAVYFIFGYFVAWQFGELRLFYSGSTENAGFVGQLMNNINDNPVIYPFQVMRGFMFASFILPLVNMLRDNRVKCIISVWLVYFTTAIVLIIPNILFPDAVRWAHFYEMSSSMSLFGIIVGFVLYTPTAAAGKRSSGGATRKQVHGS
ncbi:MAG: hypothetical protein FWH01_06225 [Oscillospiraceae bacterium]|nr:hypothetical protein [Oscillospiraceae bacterium]